ncbi:MAG: NAD(P)-dependent oxidoreductase [Ktedonobacterales bacterium]
MKLTVFGATGGTGAYVVRMALEAGHLVTAVARNPERVDIRHENLRVLRGDVLDFASVDQAVSGQDAVISCIGSTRGQKPVTTYSAGTDNILRAMQAHGVKRFLCISANPLVVGNGDLLLDRIVLKPIVRQIFKESYADLRRMEAEVRRSGLNWTIMRPPRLLNRPPTGRYRVAYDRNLPSGRSIARGDLAGALLRMLNDSKAIHAAVTVAY